MKTEAEADAEAMRKRIVQRNRKWAITQVKRLESREAKLPKVPSFHKVIPRRSARAQEKKHRPSAGLSSDTVVGPADEEEDTQEMLKNMKLADVDEEGVDTMDVD